MRRWNLVRYVLTGSAAAVLLAGCTLRQAQGDMQGQGGMLPGTMQQGSAIAARSNSTHNYKVVYTFRGPDGGWPSAGLIDVGGTLYGTTELGGSYTGGYCGGSSPAGCGTVFSLTTRGKEKVLHSFAPPSGDGSNPVAGLIDVGGTLYGTTFEGGAYVCGIPEEYFGCGTVFSITTGGTEKVLHSFGLGSDGIWPLAPLVNVKGTLYGTTYEGGPYTFFCSDTSYNLGCGTVFSITTDGTETILHDFKPRRSAHWPHAGLIDVGHKLYGTTSEGGRYKYFGTVFSITHGGKEKVLYSFGKGADGADPTGSLIEVKGTFYGTTSSGGAYGGGTVFSITPSGTEEVLHSFGAGTDGVHPNGPLIEVKGAFYGTTSFGGPYQCFGGNCGTVFSITPSGTEKVLHNFGNGTDGTQPHAPLIEVKGKLYGTTQQGGAYGNGTVFALTP